MIFIFFRKIVKMFLVYKIAMNVINKARKYITYRLKTWALKYRIKYIRKRYLKDSLVSNEQGTSGNGESPKLIVSLTSYGSRINTVFFTIESLLQQTHKPDLLLLWLAKGEFDECCIPDSLRAQQKRGLSIQYCDDIKSYKKLIPTLIAFPEAVIITVDDDVIYPRNLVEILYNEHIDHPQDIIFTRGRVIPKAINNGIIEYKFWDNNCDMQRESRNYCPIGVGGVLYPPHSLDEEVLNREVFMEIAPTADDLWFKTMSAKKRTISRQTSYRPPFYSDSDFLWDFIPTEDCQESKLSDGNVTNNKNDLQFDILYKKYCLEKYLEGGT